MTPQTPVAEMLLAICEEIANDPKVDLVDSERRIRLYYAINHAKERMAKNER